MYKLFLDDFRKPMDCFSYTRNPIYLSDDWVVVRNYDQFVDTITKRGLPFMVSFDHDLADVHYHSTMKHIPYDEYVEKTGYHCAQWLIDYCIDNKKCLPERIYVHSMNVVGRKNIDSLFLTYLKLYDC